MAETTKTGKRSLTPDWFVQGILTKIGDTFDRLLGRGWKPSSSLATSELIERLKLLLDAEAKENGDHARFVPHNIKLKMQWDKFSTDADQSLKKLETELLTAAIDHINDKRYYTYAPVSLQVKPDYFTSGVKLFVSFDSADDAEGEAEILIPNEKGSTLASDKEESAAKRIGTATFESRGKPIKRNLIFSRGSRLSVGRTRESDLSIDDISVSKIHASLTLSPEGNILIADTGSTNGTFVNNERIPYGKAREIRNGDALRFGTVDVTLELHPLVEPEPTEPTDTETYSVGEFEFTKHLNSKARVDDPMNREEHLDEPIRPGIENENV